MFHLVRGDVEAAIKCSGIYLTINRLAVADYDTAMRFNGHAEFWNVTKHGLQIGMFMAIGRAFDQRRDAYTIEDVVDQTIEHPGFFSKSALRERKREVSKIFGDQEDPPWLVEYIRDAWEPTRKELEALRTALEPHVLKFREVYEPIRNQYFAHRGRASQDVIDELFSKTAISEVADMLRFAYGLIGGIQQMANNATPPGKWSDGGYHRLFRVHEEKTESLVKSLP